MEISDERPVGWQLGPEPPVDDVHRLLGGVDAAFGNVVEKSQSDVRHLLADGSAWWAYDVAGVLCGVALTVPHEECVTAVDVDQARAALLLAQGAALLDEALSAGASLWLPTRDRDGEAVAKRLGLIPEYTDLQMRTHTTAGARGQAPSGTRLREFDASASALQDIHDLVCAAWGVEDHWSAFLERFGQSARVSQGCGFCSRAQEGSSWLPASATSKNWETGASAWFATSTWHLLLAGRPRLWALTEAPRPVRSCRLAGAQVGVQETCPRRLPPTPPSGGRRLVPAQVDPVPAWVTGRLMDAALSEDLAVDVTIEVRWNSLAKWAGHRTPRGGDQRRGQARLFAASWAVSSGSAVCAQRERRRPQLPQADVSVAPERGVWRSSILSVPRRFVGSPNVPGHLLRHTGSWEPPGDRLPRPRRPDARWGDCLARGVAWKSQRLSLGDGRTDSCNCSVEPSHGLHGRRGPLRARGPVTGISWTP